MVNQFGSYLEKIAYNLIFEGKAMLARFYLAPINILDRYWDAKTISSGWHF